MPLLISHGQGHSQSSFVNILSPKISNWIIYNFIQFWETSASAPASAKISKIGLGFGRIVTVGRTLPIGRDGQNHLLQWFSKSKSKSPKNSDFQNQNQITWAQWFWSKSLKSLGNQKWFSKSFQNHFKITFKNILLHIQKVCYEYPMGVRGGSKFRF